MTNQVRYPEVTVKLVGGDGNAFAILAACQRKARRCKLPANVINEFMQEATSGDYNNLLAVCQRWFTIL